MALPRQTGLLVLPFMLLHSHLFSILGCASIERARILVSSSVVMPVAIFEQAMSSQLDRHGDAMDAGHEQRTAECAICEICHWWTAITVCGPCGVQLCQYDSGTCSRCRRGPFCFTHGCEHTCMPRRPPPRWRQSCDRSVAVAEVASDEGELEREMVWRS